ncbi:hypothetical protein [Natrialba sp. INN-245]|uniref:hypothetical protein n=1 Tax=Natrialba sp. INN-245 TaxID=2690967 RepID=UPI001312E6B4|nr:hypothetical protein [Natrialba sp. INN-245]MWV40989.1 hypothetical protein [Natrialba sp. INN-245]
MSSNAKRKTGRFDRHIDPDRLAKRLDAIDQWVAHINSTPAPEWGAELNNLINSQVSGAEALSENRGEDFPQFDQFDPDAIREAGQATD